MTMQLAKALSEVMKVPVLGNDGDLSEATATIIARYRDL